MKKVLITLAPGFEEIESITVVDILRRAGARVDVAGTEPGPLEGSRGVKVVPDMLVSEVESGDYDLVVVPGGQPGVTHLQENERVLAIIREMKRDDKKIAAICAAPLVLQSAGVLGKDISTSHPSVREKLNEVQYSEDRVVVDGNLITSRSPGTAMEFAMKLVEVLFGPDRVKVVNDGVIAKL